MHPSQDPAYRGDVDGLRAIAVGVVLLFHAFPHVLPGGFVGVDIFFVISGYLITRILAREVQAGQFSIIAFYVRRARRIFPALLVVLLATIVVGWQILLPHEWEALGKHVAAGSAFLSNVVLWREAGYFDGASDLKPLLHLWSLGVEEQYYLVWPWVVWLAAKRGWKFLLGAALVLFGLSLASSVVLSGTRPVAAFFLPFTRFWELLVGSGLGLYQAMHANAGGGTAMAPSWRWAASLGGLLLLAVSVLALDQSSVFPGYLAALPCVGAALLLAAGPQASVNRWLLASRPMVWIGLLSYPLYLWHWPLLSLQRIWFGDEPPMLHRLAALLLALLLSALTVRWIEAPVRNAARGRSGRRDAAILWLLLLGLGGVGVAAWTETIHARSWGVPLVRKITEAQAGWQELEDRSYQGGQPTTVLFVGDSLMQHYHPRIATLMADNAQARPTVRIITRAGCAPVPGLNRKSVDCASFVRQAYEAMQAPEVRTIVLSASWQGFSQRPDYYRSNDGRQTPIKPLTDDQAWIESDWAAQLRRLTDAGKRVVVVLSSPRGPLVEPTRLVDRSLGDWGFGLHTQPRERAVLKGLVERVDARVAAVARAAGAATLDPFDALCTPAACPVLDADGRPIYIDDSHLRADYVRRQVHFLDAFVTAAAQ